ncbi:MAG: hypothetical protein ACRDLO_02500, partial [Solirubrobacterales bacterium]
ARGAGFRVLFARAGELERELTWGVARDLLAPVLASATEGERRRLLAGAAGLSWPALAGGDDEVSVSPGADPGSSALYGLHWLAAGLAEQAPVLIAVDDAQWADRPSLRFLAYLAHRVGDLPLLLALAARSPAPAGPDEVLPRIAARAHLVRPAPLSPGATGVLIRHRLRHEPAAEFVSACHEATGGNPFLLHELLLELEREGVGTGADDAAFARGARPEAISRAVLLRLSPLAAQAHELARAVAVFGSETTGARASALAGLSEDAAVESVGRLEAAEILSPGLPLRFVHPIVRSVVYEEIPAAARARLHARAMALLSEVGAPAEEVGVQALAVEPSSEPRTIDVLREAAAVAIERGAPGGAVTYLRRALAEPPSPTMRARVLLELANAEAVAGHTEALGRLEEALELVDERVERARLMLRIGELLYAASRLPEAAEAFDRGLAELDEADDAELFAELRTARTGVLGLVGEIGAEELERQSAVVASRADEELTAAGRQMLVQRAVAGVFAAHSHSEVGALAARALGEGAMLEGAGVPLNFTIAVSCLFWADAFEPAELEIERALEQARAAGDLMTSAYLLFGRAQPRYWRGRVADAAVDAGAAVDAWRGGWQMHLPFAGHWQAVSLVELDQLDAAAEALRATRPSPGMAPIYEAFWRSGRLRVALARGDLDAAWREHEAVGSLAEGIPYVHNPTVWPWRSDGAVVAARRGERELADRLASEELEIARRFGAPRPIGLALRARGLVVGGEPGIELLREAVGTLAPSGAELELCRARVDLGAILRRTRQRTAAREALRAALDEARQL